MVLIKQSIAATEDHKESSGCQPEDFIWSSTLSMYCWSLSMTVALPLSAGRDVLISFSSRTSKQCVVCELGCQ